MPIFDFRCRECGQTSELFLPSSLDSKTLACPSCNSQNLERLIAAPNLLKNKANAPGTTCCGREERCEVPPCSTENGCRRH